MDLKQLEYFTQVAELGSFTRAANVLDVAQPVLSRHVRQLEVELGEHLLLRDGRGVRPTEAGKRLLEHGLLILQQVQRARQDLKTQHGAAVGNVVLGLPTHLSPRIGVALVEAFVAQFPQASLAIVEGLPRYIAESLLNGRIDLGLMHSGSQIDGIDYTPLLEEHLHLVAPISDKRKVDASAVDLAQIPDYPMILPSRSFGLRKTVDAHLANLALKPQIAMEVSGVNTVLALVAAGHGYTLLPLSALLKASLADRLRLSPIRNPDIRMTLSIARSAVRPETPLASATAKLMAKLVLDLMGPAR